MEIKQKLDEIKQQFYDKIKDVKIHETLENLRVEYFGKKSVLTELLKNIKNISDAEKPLIGKLVNEIRAELTLVFEDKKLKLETSEQNSGIFDFSIPGKNFEAGNLHPITKVMNEIIEIFEKLGFTTVKGPDIESDYYNFEALNFPENHPARDMQDTFFIKNQEEPLLLRTHTSPVQIRFMKKHRPPFQIIAPGSVYRCDNDVSHSPMFHQIEGLCVGEDISFANLKWILTEFVNIMFGKNTKIRFRPGFFPFTEPSAEIDISCVICGGEGCRVCKGIGWLEILGAGMVHPNVFKNCGYNPDEIQGFAFGMGIERIAMLKYEINDIRLLFENDLRFLRQF